jgi:uncharacterized membrane protein YfcA
MGGASEVLAGAGTGLAGGFLSGLFGIGGGIVMVPLLAVALGLDQHRAQGVTLAAMLLPNSLPAVLHYRQRGVPIHWALVGWMLLGFLPGIIGGAWSANLIPALPLRWGFAGFLVLVALRTLLAKAGPPAGRENFLLDRNTTLWGLLTGLCGGLSAGLLGIGGGVVVIPILLWKFRMQQQEAQLQSLVLLLPPLGIPGVMVYAAAQGGLPWALLGGLALGFMAGAYLGARVGTALAGPALKRAFAVLLLVAAALLIWKNQ